MVSCFLISVQNVFSPMASRVVRVFLVNPELQISIDSYLDVQSSNWPRGEGYKTLSDDITRALAWSA